MSQSGTFATLIIVSILSRRPCVVAATSTRRGSDGSDADGDNLMDQRKMLESMLHGAIVALTVMCAVASSMPPSSSDPVTNAYESSGEVPEDCLNNITELDDSTTCSSITEQKNSEKVDEENHIKHSDVYPIVDWNNVKTSWTRRARLSRASKARNLLQQYQPSSHTQREPVHVCGCDEDIITTINTGV